MGMTLVEKILAKHCGREKVSPDEIVDVSVDVCMTHDVLGAHTIAKFKELEIEKVFDPEKIVVIPDHYVPNKDIDTAKKCLNIRRFVVEQGISNYYEVGKGGICHQVLLEKGHILPGEVVVGTDSHTTTGGVLGAFCSGIGVDEMACVFKKGKLWERVPHTLRVNVEGKLAFPLMSKDVMLFVLSRIGVDGALFKTVEFCGQTIRDMTIESRGVLTNMAIEAGATNGIIEPDVKVSEYLKNRTNKDVKLVKNDPDAKFWGTSDFNTDEIKEPIVAPPPKPSTGVPVSKVAGTKIDQAFIGSCTNGKLEDLRIAAKILEGRKVAKYTRAIIIPASQEIYLEALKEGLLSTFVEAGAVVSTPTCGPCLEAHMGILGPCEVSISTTNRNFPGRAGDPTSMIYLASPATVAASAIEGKITDPRKYL